MGTVVRPRTMGTLSLLLVAAVLPPGGGERVLGLPEFAGILSGQPAAFRKFIADHNGKVVRLQIYFDKEVSTGEVMAKAVYPPYGYKGDGDLALFNVGDRTFWLQGSAKGKSWTTAPYWNAKDRSVVGRFQVRKNLKAGGGKWYDLTYVGPAGAPNIPKDAGPDR